MTYSFKVNYEYEAENCNLHIKLQVVTNIVDLILSYFTINLCKVCVDISEERKRNSGRTAFRVCSQYFTNYLHGICDTLQEITNKSTLLFKPWSCLYQVRVCF